MLLINPMILPILDFMTIMYIAFNLFNLNCKLIFQSHKLTYKYNNYNLTKQVLERYNAFSLQC